jgi:hypothetical protein
MEAPNDPSDPVAATPTDSVDPILAERYDQERLNLLATPEEVV